MDRSRGDLPFLTASQNILCQTILSSYHRRPPLRSLRAGWPWPHPEVDLPATCTGPASWAPLRTGRRTRPGQESSS